MKPDLTHGPFAGRWGGETKIATAAKADAGKPCVSKKAKNRGKSWGRRGSNRQADRGKTCEGKKTAADHNEIADLETCARQRASVLDWEKQKTFRVEAESRDKEGSGSKRFKHYSVIKRKEKYLAEKTARMP